jgi:hypothetical protein
MLKILTVKQWWISGFCNLKILFGIVYEIQLFVI